MSSPMTALAETPTHDAPARVLLAGENDGQRAQVRAAFDRQRRVEVVAETAGREQLADTADALCPELIVLCAGPKPSADVLRALAERCPSTHVLVLGHNGAPKTPGAAAALRATAECLRAMADAAGGEFDPDGLLTTVRPPTPSDESAARHLTAREREVLQGVADGLSSKEIATKLSISVRTVESHRNQIMKKVGLRSVAGLTKFAIRQGLVTL